MYTGPLFTEWTDVLLQDLMESRSSEIQVQTSTITLEFDSHLHSSTAEMLVKFQSDTIVTTSNVAALSLHKIWQ